MKKLAMFLLALVLSFGFTSGAIAGNTGADYDYGKDDKVTYKDGITTVVTKKKEVTYDKIVKVEKFTDYSTEKKYDKSTFEKVDVDVKKEYHPKHDWYRDVTTKTTYEITKTTSWDEVTKTITTKKTTIPVIITKTTITTKKFKGKPGKGGKLISKKTKVHVDKKFGKAKVEISKEKFVTKENVKTDYDKKVIDVEVTKGKWNKGDKHDKDDKGGKGGKGGKDKD
ncbi:hypothetical protein [Planococcus shixiaomingii]|uniref:hypothetical protein n=1 Tax=Planococcus shixiaomingii TaxID=3058393 RepID=UPI002609DFC7|nr:hypothetical protein [Planococcus sp. N022]WKA55617.1 hypothetical protein QWY21_04300 [Planococcus sp. N022]